MTRIFYFVLPFVLMVAFGGYYYGVFYKGEVARIEREEADKKAKEEAAAKAKKEAEEKASREAKDRADEKRRQEDKKRDDRRREQEAADNELRTKTEEAESRAAALSKQRADLEIQLVELRRSREAEQRKAFDLRVDVERAKIDRRNAELEIQLNTEKIASRVDASSMVQMPIFPTATTGKGESSR